MPTGRRRPSLVTAVVGLLCGVVLLLGAVLDGGLSTPTRVDLRRPAEAAPTLDRSAPRPTGTREDGRAWDDASSPGRPAVPGLVAVPGPAPLAVAAGVALLAVSAVVGASRRAPAGQVARHRGPPRPA